VFNRAFLCLELENADVTQMKNKIKKSQANVMFLILKVFHKEK